MANTPTAKHRFGGLRLAIVLATLTVLVAAPQATLAKRAAVTCEVHPGDSGVTWKSEPQTTSIELQWFDADGALILTVTVVPTKALHSRYSQQTPEGANDFGASFSDANGVYAVGGLVCT
jgi:hypothetical protein